MFVGRSDGYKCINGYKIRGGRICDDAFLCTSDAACPSLKEL